MIEENNQLTSSRKFVIPDINAALSAPISRIETLRDDEGRKGFTLIELLVVVLIIGILAAVAVPQYKLAVAKSGLVQLQTRLNAIEKAVQIYFLTNNTFPTDIRKLDIGIEKEGAQYGQLSRLTSNSNVYGLIYPNRDQCGTVAYNNTFMIYCVNKHISLRNDYQNYPEISSRYCTAQTTEGEKICYNLSKNKRIIYTYDSGLHQYDLD